MSRFRRWCDRWAMFLGCLLVLAISIVAIPASLAAGRNDGTFGTFTAVRKDCLRSSCEWFGTFASDDGRIRMDAAHFASDELERPGDEARAQKVPGDESLYKPDSKAWIFFVLGDVLCLGYVIWWIRARRRARPSPDPDRLSAGSA
ncbi:hypothetical protein [Pimelobacter simplex]|uniref:hypothetical protein n=1 Tax=Nocardioides simplex TaxID=2045 RepID=UPI003AAB9FA3